MRKFRYIVEGHGSDSLTQHEILELNADFDIQTGGFYVLAPLTKDEWTELLNKNQAKGIGRGAGRFGDKFYLKDSDIDTVAV